MQPVFQKIDADINHSFYVGHRKSKNFPNPFMFHPEIEILLVIKGTGTCLIGDYIGRFSPGDLVMIGKNVPHVWYSDEEYSKDDSDLMSEAVFILFKTEIFGEEFLNLPELRSINSLIQFSRRGIKLKGKTLEEVTSLIISMSKSEGLKRINILLSILEVIASTKEYKLLSSPLIQGPINQSDSDRLDKVYKFVIDNFHQSITVGEASAVANLSISAFCHYFKRRTNNTFIHFLTEIRIAFACRLLTEENESVENVCFACGYTNVSYFIKQFKDRTSFTPLSYRKKFKG